MGKLYYAKMKTARDAFNELFEDTLKQFKNKEMAFNKADERFKIKHGFGAYSGYESFRVTKAKRKPK